MSSDWKDRKGNDPYTPEQLLSLIWEEYICSPLIDCFIPFTDLRRNYPELKEELEEIYYRKLPLLSREDSQYFREYLLYIYYYILDKEGFTES